MWVWVKVEARVRVEARVMVVQCRDERNSDPVQPTEPLCRVQLDARPV